MAGLSPPSLQSLESERFRVLPLWNWSLAAATLVDDDKVYVGVGFDPKRATARLKARSEAIERRLYGRWRRSGISPFTNESCQAPPPASGFAVHPDRAEAEIRAFFEWRERAALFAAGERKLTLLPASVPDMGLLFRAGLVHVGCKLEAFVSGGPPFVAFALGTLDPQGVVFGSACRLSAEEAIRSAAAECLRKTAYLQEWRGHPESTDPFLNSIRFWISKDGLLATKRFVENAAASRDALIDLPREMESARLQSLRLDDLWVSHYEDLHFPLPEVGGRSIPLV
jgi:ribosomal protein S12 methylthiotransferase accessory factor YcaO